MMGKRKKKVRLPEDEFYQMVATIKGKLVLCAQNDRTKELWKVNHEGAPLVGNHYNKIENAESVRNPIDNDEVIKLTPDYDGE